MSKKVHFTPAAENQLQLFFKLDSVRTGFTIGIEIGKHVIIENLLPLNFDKKNIDIIYPEVLNKTGEKLIGPFFKGNSIIRSDWFIGDLIIKIGDIGNKIFYYDETFLERK